MKQKGSKYIIHFLKSFAKRSVELLRDYSYFMVAIERSIQTPTATETGPNRFLRFMKNQCHLRLSSHAENAN